MNIFYLSHDTKECALWHCDRHAVKMPLEHVQLLSTAHRVLDGTMVVEKSKTGRNVKRWKLHDHRESILYSATHVNHPSAVWARSSKENYLWLHQMTIDLCEEYTYRYGKTMKIVRDGLVSCLASPPQNISDLPFTQPTPAMPDECIVKGDSVASYRAYYNQRKRHLFHWKNREIPPWITES